METKCDICGKVIPKTNTNTRIIDGCKYTLCGKHYQQYIRFGKIIDSDPNSVIYDNTYDIFNDRVIVHTYKRGSGEEAGSFVIDKNDFDLVKTKHWRCWKGNFITGNFNPISISRFIFGLSYNDDKVVDHINGDRTDNRRSNLRIVNQQTNAANHPGAGVRRVPSGRYQAIVTRHYKPIYIGTFDTYEEASDARKKFIANYDANDPSRVSIPVVQ